MAKKRASKKTAKKEERIIVDQNKTVHKSVKEVDDALTEGKEPTQRFKNIAGEVEYLGRTPNQNNPNTRRTAIIRKVFDEEHFVVYKPNGKWTCNSLDLADPEVAALVATPNMSSEEAWMHGYQWRLMPEKEAANPKRLLFLLATTLAPDEINSQVSMTTNALEVWVFIEGAERAGRGGLAVHAKQVYKELTGKAYNPHQPPDKDFKKKKSAPAPDPEPEPVAEPEVEQPVAQDGSLG